MVVFIVFVLVACLPLLAHRSIAKRAANIRKVYLLSLGDEDINEGQYDRKRRAKYWAFWGWTGIIVAGEMLAFKFVDSLDVALFIAVLLGGLGFAISQGLERVFYEEFDRRAATIEIEKALRGESVVISSREILSEGKGYRAVGKSLVPEGHGSSRIVSAEDSGMVEASQHHLGGR